MGWNYESDAVPKCLHIQLACSHEPALASICSPFHECAYLEEGDSLRLVMLLMEIHGKHAEARWGARHKGVPGLSQQPWRGNSPTPIPRTTDSVLLHDFFFSPVRTTTMYEQTPWGRYFQFSRVEKFSLGGGFSFLEIFSPSFYEHIVSCMPACLRGHDVGMLALLHESHFLLNLFVRCCGCGIFSILPSTDW